MNQNQRYATTSLTGAIIRRIAELKGVPIQEYIARNDTPCGSTIGPAMAAKLGIPTIDIGAGSLFSPLLHFSFIYTKFIIIHIQCLFNAAQLSMHSIREMCDITSVKMTSDLLEVII